MNVKDGNTRLDNDLGFFKNIENEDYHKINGVSSSKLGLLLDCPAKYNNIQKTKATLDFGTAFHMYFLEREEFDEKYGVLHEKNGATKAAKEEKKLLIEKGYDSFVKKAELNAFEKMTQTILSDPISDALFNADDEHYIEHSGFWKFESVLCKCRPDYLLIKNNQAFVIDIKTTTDCSPEKIARSIADWSYHRQAAFYADGIKEITGIQDVHALHFFIEKPMDGAAIWNEQQMAANALQCLPVTIPEADLEQGRREYKQAISNYQKFMNENVMPGYKKMAQIKLAEQLDFVEIGLPNFKKDEINRLENAHD